MGERIPHLSFARNGRATIAGVSDPVGWLKEVPGRVYGRNGWRALKGWEWHCTADCPQHLAVDFGWHPRRGFIIGKLYDLHAPTVQAAYDKRKARTPSKHRKTAPA